MSFFYISRVRVEGGFLDGIDIEFSSGFNTIIGARGTGKSSIVELIRYCFNIQGHSTESNQKSISHAKSVLGDGQVTVYLSNEEDTYTYTRNFVSESFDSTATWLNKASIPHIFSQTEIENIGLTSQGRLKLIDGFLFDLHDMSQSENSKIAIVHSYSAEIIALRASIDECEDKLLAIPNIKQEISEIAEKESEIAQSSLIAESKNSELKSLEEQYIKLYDEIKSHQDSELNLLKLVQTLDTFLEQEKNLPNIFEEDNTVTEQLKSISKNIFEAQNVLKAILEKNKDYMKSMKIDLDEITKKGINLRTEFDQIQKGAGEVARKRQHLYQLFFELESIQKINIEKESRLLELQIKRNSAIDSLRDLRQKRSKLRMEKCIELSQILKPRIKVSLEIESQLDEYQQVLINSLKGSSIKYNEIVPVICESVPPLVLLNIIENNDVDTFTLFVSISKDRAIKVINALKNSLDKIATVLLDDEVKLELLDGSEYKEFYNLSTGQRCTVILPIILEHIDNTLIIDQPEDHIDNAFIVDTLVSSIVRRSGKGQVIVTTHNANLPVLGNAQRVIHLNSDGTRGFVVTDGELEEKAIINAISNVMEGGKEAFLRRADFYG